MEKTHRNSLQPGFKLHWYEIKEILGQGGFGITYLAHDTNLDEDVAIKEFLPIELAIREGDFSIHPLSEGHKKSYEWGLDRFVKEARTLTKFKHPSIVRVRSVFQENNTAYMVMEYEHGESLQQLLTRRGTLEEAELLNMIIPLLGGLDKVHETGFIHRDIKPANIFIRDDGSPVLLDFGSARQALGEETKTLTSLVSPGYAPFEQYYSKSDEQGPYTDIYGLGATLYRAVTGLGPMDAVDRSKSILKTSSDTIVTASEIAKGKYSERFLAAIDHAMMFKSEDRPQTVSNWKNEFDLPDNPLRVANEVEQQVTRPGATVLARQQKKKSRKIPAIILVLIILAGAGAYFQEDMLSEIRKWQEKDEIKSLLSEAQGEHSDGDKVLTNYRRVLEMQPDNAEARIGLQSITSQLTAKARDAIRAGDFSTAEKMLAEAMDILPNADNIKLVANELDEAKTTLNQKLIKEKARAEQLENIVIAAQMSADNGQIIETLGHLEKARTLGADAQVISEVKKRLRSALEAQVEREARRANQFMKKNDTGNARLALKRAKEIKAQLDALN